jgi:beta-phosphoglucomutase
VDSLHSRAWREALREPRRKPDPLIFVTAASEIGAVPGRCFMAEDAVSGVQAGGMAALGVARLGDEMALGSAGADLVVRTGVPQR